MLKKLLLSLLLLSSSAQAYHEFEINLNNKDLDLHLDLDMGQFNHSIEPENLMIQTRLLMGSEDNALLPFEKSENLLGELGFMAQATSAMAPGLTMGMGVKLAYGYQKNGSVFALPIGAKVDYVLPFDIFIPIHVGGQFYYAPEVLSFSDSTSYMEYEGAVDFELMERGLITMGYRGIDTPLKNYSKAYYNRSFFFGFKFKF